MPVKEIDRDKLRTAIRKMGDEYSYYLLDDAIDLLPQTKLAKLIKGYLDPEKLRPDGKKQTLINDVEAFRDASLRSEYYESFDVNSKNCTQTSRGTRAWISECNRLLGRLTVQAKKSVTSEIGAAFDIIFGLLDHIDECHDDIIFFADEGGSWQVGVQWEKVFPPYFRSSSAAILDPDKYAQRVVELVDKYEKWRRTKHLATARRVATPSQKKALREA